ncbi:MAG: hypothetical protein ACRD3S_00560, partial [Terracidiphilus sp.]
MTDTRKTIAALFATGFLIMGAIAGCYWWASSIPRRPPEVTADAVFLRAPYVGLPAPRRGWWMSCWAGPSENYCKLSNVNGKTEYDGAFISYDRGEAPLPVDRLKINA